jgi:prophage regulatory protein
MNESTEFSMRLLRLKEVLNRTGLGRSYTYRLIAEGKFPKSVPLGGRSVAWVEEEVEEWILARIEERDTGIGVGDGE